jgi:hypothetical protein
MKAQLQFSILIRGRQYSRILKREDTTSDEGTASFFRQFSFWKTIFHSLKARGDYLRPLRQFGSLLRNQYNCYAIDNM